MVTHYKHRMGSNLYEACGPQNGWLHPAKADLPCFADNAIAEGLPRRSPAGECGPATP